MKRILAIMLSLGMVLSLCACQNETVDTGDDPGPVNTTDVEPENTISESDSDESVVIETMGMTMTYDKIPERVVALSYSIAEMLVALGLEDRIVAIAPSMYILDQVSEEYRDTVGAFPVLEGDYGVPTLETVLGVDPDFVFGDTYSFYASSVGTAEDFETAGVMIYATEGTYVEDATFENIYNDLLNIGKIFHVEDRAEELVAELRNREAAVTEEVSGLEPVSVFYFDSDTGGGVDMSTVGSIGLQNYMLEIAGADNVFSDEETQFMQVSMEQVITRDPEYIIVCDYYGEGYAEERIEAMKSDPQTANMTAVVNDNFVVVPGLAMFPSLECFDVVEQIADAIHP